MNQAGKFPSSFNVRPHIERLLDLAILEVDLHSDLVKSTLYDDGHTSITDLSDIS